MYINVPWSPMGQRWNLRKFTSFSCQLQVSAARVSHFLDAETCEFSQFSSLSMGVHGTLMYINLTFINYYFRTGFPRWSVNYLPSINSARYTQRILQTVKSRIGPFRLPNPRKSILELEVLWMCLSAVIYLINKVYICVFSMFDTQFTDY